MAKTVFRSETIELLDGTAVTLRPLSIKNMRAFQEEFAKMQADSDESEVDSALDGLVALAFCCLQQDNKEIAAKKEELEERLDLDSAYKIIEVCAGIKLNDPNLVAAAQALVD